MYYHTPRHRTEQGGEERDTKINKTSIKIDINIVNQFQSSERSRGEIYVHERELIVFNFNGAVKNDHQQINKMSNFLGFMSSLAASLFGYLFVCAVIQREMRFCWFLSGFRDLMRAWRNMKNENSSTVDLLHFITGLKSQTFTQKSFLPTKLASPPKNVRNDTHLQLYCYAKVILCLPIFAKKSL